MRMTWLNLFNKQSFVLYFKILPTLLFSIQIACCNSGSLVIHILYIQMLNNYMQTSLMWLIIGKMQIKHNKKKSSLLQIIIIVIIKLAETDNFSSLIAY